jgi:hypothetical protein
LKKNKKKLDSAPSSFSGYRSCVRFGVQLFSNYLHNYYLPTPSFSPTVQKMKKNVLQKSNDLNVLVYLMWVPDNTFDKNMASIC